MGRKRRRSPEPFLVFFGPITRKEIEVRRKLGLYENPDKDINMDDLDSEFWDYYYADENDEKFNLTAQIKKSPTKSKLNGNTLHLSLLNEKENRNDILSSKKVRLSKKQKRSENVSVQRILTESVSNLTLTLGESPIRSTRSSFNVSLQSGDGSTIANAEHSKTSVRPFRITRSSKVDAQDFNHMSEIAENVIDQSLSVENRPISNHLLASMTKSDVVESNDDLQMIAMPENVFNHSERLSRRLSNTHSSNVNHVHLSMTKNSDLVDNDHIPATPENIIENSKPPGRSSRRFSKTQPSDVIVTSVVGTEMVESNDHEIPATPENALIENAKPPGRSSRRLSKTPTCNVNLASAVGTEMVVSNDHQIPATPENATIENSKPPARSSHRLSKTPNSDVISAVSTKMVESNDQIPATPEDAMIENSKPPGRSCRRLSKTSPQSSSISVSSSNKRNSKIPVSSKCRDIILRNIRNAGIVKTPKAKTPGVQRISSIPVSAKKLSSRATNVNNTPQGIRTPLAQQSFFSSSRSSSSKLMPGKSAIATPVARTSTVASTFNSAAKCKAWSTRQQTTGQNTPLSAIKRIYITPQVKKGPSDTPLSTVKTLYRTHKPQILDTPETPLSAVKRIYKTPNVKPTDVFNIGSSNRNVPSTPSSTSRTSIVKSELFSAMAASPKIKPCSVKKDIALKNARISTVKTPQMVNQEVNVVASTSKMHDSLLSQSGPKKSTGKKSRKNSNSSARFSSKTPFSLKRLTPKLPSTGKPNRRSNKKSSIDSYRTPDSFEDSKNYSFTPDVPKVKTNFLKAPKLLVNGNEIDANWTSKLNPNKVVQAKRPNYMYSPTILNKK